MNFQSCDYEPIQIEDSFFYVQSQYLIEIGHNLTRKYICEVVKQRQYLNNEAKHQFFITLDSIFFMRWEPVLFQFLYQRHENPPLPNVRNLIYFKLLSLWNYTFDYKCRKF